MRTDKIYLYWYKHGVGYGNFGDEINHYIVSKISTQEVEHVDLNYLQDDKLLALKIIIVALLKRNLSLYEFFKYVRFNFYYKPKVLLAIGSVLHKINYFNCTVWGAGIISKDVIFTNAKFLAVRGRCSQKRLKELQYLVPDVVGDPAILLPLIFKVETTKKYRLGIIPHYAHYAEMKNKLEREDILVIDLLDDIESIIKNISSCDLCLSTSLHGLIVSHAYKVPALWVDFNDINTNLFGDNIKFYDYFGSVDISEYRPFVFSNISQVLDNDILNEMISANRTILLPREDVITKMQSELLRVAPFTLRKEL